MHLIRAATVTVANLDTSQQLYAEWLDYNCIESGQVSPSLAQSWGTPNTTGCAYAVMQPASGAPVYIRFIEQPARDDYVPLTTYGWSALEICNQDTLAVNARMERSPFEIIGPPRELDGMPAIFPMQVKGPDGEIVYLTEIRDDLPEYDLPRASSLIDKLFILVMGCSDMEASGAWLEKHLLLDKGRSIEIIYTMISKAFGQPMDTKHAIATLKHERDVFIEIDALPDAATARARHDGMLPPCFAIGSFIHPDFDRLMEINANHWITPPVIRDGDLYKGKRVGTLKAPDGTLFEMIEA